VDCELLPAAAAGAVLVLEPFVEPVVVVRDEGADVAVLVAEDDAVPDVVDAVVVACWVPPASATVSRPPPTRPATPAAALTRRTRCRERFRTATSDARSFMFMGPHSRSPLVTTWAMAVRSL
jgi:hypothetical protein